MKNYTIFIAYMLDKRKKKNGNIVFRMKNDALE